MEVTPITPALDVLSYRGDAALAAGSGGGGMPIPIDTKPVESTIDKLQNEEIQKRQQQRIWDHQDLGEKAKFISNLTNSGGSIFNMKGPDGTNHSYSVLPEDDKVLTDKTEEIINDINAHPDTYEFDADIQKKIMERNRLLNYAQMRAMHDANNRVMAAQVIDPEDKQGYLKNSKENIDDHPLAEFHPITPYSPGPAISGDDFIKKGADDPKNLQLVNDDGTTETYVVPNNLMIDPRNLTPGDPLYYKAIKWAQKFIASPQAQDKSTAIKLNNAVANYNAVRKLTPNDPGYMQPVFDINPNTGELSFHEKDLNKLPFEVAAALNVEKHGQPITFNKTAEQLAKIEKEKAGTEKEKAEMRYKEVEQDKVAKDIEKINAEIEEKKAQTAKLKGEAKDKALKQQQEIEQVNAPVATYLGVMKDARGKRFSAIPATIAPALSSQGIDASKYQATLLNQTDEGVKHISGIQGVDVKGKPQPIAVNPTGAYYLKSSSGNPKDDFIAVSYSEDGKTKWKTIQPNEAVGNIIKSTKNFTGITDKTIESIGKSQSKLNEYLAGTKGASQSKPKAQVTKVLNGKTYVRDEKGDWYEQ